MVSPSVEENGHHGKSFTTVPSFVDTNILLYAEDRDGKAKHKVARNLVTQLWESRDGVLSVQVLQEFYVNVTRKVRKPLTSQHALDIVQEYLTWTVIENTGQLLAAAIILRHKHQLSFWDALVVQAAIEGGCTTLYTEDLNHGQRFGAVVILNPFK
jgi:predicted nucleic acid-binding protein